VYVFFISFLIALLEAPALFYFFGPCKRLRDQLIDDLGFGKGWVRGILYILLSILCYVPKPSIALMAGKSAYRHTCEMVLGCLRSWNNNIATFVGKNIIVQPNVY
jgi:hypothetical protein